MKELVKVNVIKQEKGAVEEDLLELIFEDNTRIYIAVSEIILLSKNKQLGANWKEFKEWLREVLNESKQNDVLHRTSYEVGKIVSLESCLAKVEELESKDEKN